MKMLLAFVALVILTAACALVFFLKDAPPEVRFATAKLEDLVDTLNTNGKVEPVSWTALRADRAGRHAGRQSRCGTRLVRRGGR